MAEGIAGAGGPGVIAREEHRPEGGGIQSRHHGQRVPGPPPQDARLSGQSGGVKIAGGVVGILQENIFRPRRHGSGAGGGHLPGHLLLEGPVIVHGLALGLGPVGDAAGPLDIGADIDLHCCTLLFLSDGAVSPRYFPF